MRLAANYGPIPLAASRRKYRLVVVHCDAVEQSSIDKRSMSMTLDESTNEFPESRALARHQAAPLATPLRQRRRFR